MLSLEHPAVTAYKTDDGGRIKIHFKSKFRSLIGEWSLVTLCCVTRSEPLRKWFLTTDTRERGLVYGLFENPNVLSIRIRSNSITITAKNKTSWKHIFEELDILIVECLLEVKA